MLRLETLAIETVESCITTVKPSHTVDQVPCHQHTQLMSKNWGNKKGFFVHNLKLQLGRGGVQQQKKQRTSCDFSGGMIFFLCLRTFPAKRT